jgi:hypothetical protein
VILRRIPITSIALVAGVAAAGAMAMTHRAQPAQPVKMQMIASIKGFKLAGVPVAGLYPRAARPLVVKVTNPYTFSIKVPALTGTVAVNTTKVGCTGAKTNIVVSGAGMRPIVIPKKATRVVTMHVTMPSTVANACQGARFTITLRGKATRA